MREILFRGKRIDNGEWIIGDLSQHKTGKKFIKCGDARSSFQVDENTICQFTGLLDKNGKKIWENDIVAHKYTKYTEEPNEYPPFGAEEKVKKYVVKWDNTGVYLGYRYHNGRNIFPFKRGSVLNGNDEVIGNVFDNKELLEE